MFGNLAVEMQAQKSNSDTLQSITDAAPKVVPGARWAGISLIEGRKIGAAAETQFEAALATRDIIGQAKGILMQRQNFTGLQAFNLLARTSQETNIKLVDVARWLINQHESELEDHSTQRN